MGPAWGLSHKTFTGENTRVKSENSGKHNLTIDFTIGEKKEKKEEKNHQRFSPVKMVCNRHQGELKNRVIVFCFVLGL